MQTFCLFIHFDVVFLTAQHFKPRKTKKATVHWNSPFNKDNLQDTWNSRGKHAVDVAFALDVAGHSLVNDNLSLTIRGIINHPYPGIDSIEICCPRKQQTHRFCCVTFALDFRVIFVLSNSLCFLRQIFQNFIESINKYNTRKDHCVS